MTRSCQPVSFAARRLFGLVVAAALLAAEAAACTTAVISGLATPDGRPLLWKNRDTTSSTHNEVVFVEGERYRAVVVVNAGKRKSVWMGVNEAGFCIENSLSRDLKRDKSAKSSGPANGPFMRMALGRCKTVDDFRALLEETNASGRKTVANYGVIDAAGGAVLFETSPTSYAAFDANDPTQAPDAIVVRSNFATTARDLPGRPEPAALADIYSGDRYCRAWAVLRDCQSDGVSLNEMLRRLTRDLSDKSGRPYPGTVNGPAGTLPDAIPTADTISRTTTVSAVVFHGVRPGEDPRLTTMWTLLGDPKFSIAVPVFPVGEVADDLTDKRGGEIGEIALTLRDWSMTFGRDGVVGENLPGIWSDLWRVEDQLVDETLHRKEAWAGGPLPLAEIANWHHQAAERAMAAMEKELAEAKADALAAPVTSLPLAGGPQGALPAKILVGVYDHSKPYNGSKNLRRILTAEAGFESAVVTPQQIRDGVLADYDVLIMPGGSGSSQAKHLGVSGREAIKSFVDGGGGYVGICAGAYLASSQYKWSLGLINARVWDRVHWARGTGVVGLEVSSAGARVLETPPGPLNVYYGQGPMLVPHDDPDLPGYEVLATYAGEVAKKGAPKNAMVGLHAIVRSVYGEGRVICFSPHPEKPDGPNALMAEGVRWAGSGQ